MWEIIRFVGWGLVRECLKTRITDLEDLLPWILEESSEPNVYDAAFQQDRLYTLRSRLTAAYKSLNTLVLKEGVKDFFWTHFRHPQ